MSTSSTDPMQAEHVLEARDLWKAYPGVQALSGVSLALRPGSVHALVGENGAGKSTLLKLLNGLAQPDLGEIRFQGQVVRLERPHAARQLGIALIHQELLPFPELSVAENIFMGQLPAKGLGGWVNRRALHDCARQVLAHLGVSLDPALPMKSLGVAGMQLVEIAKALAQDARVIMMDEPTSALSVHEVERLLALIADLKHRGIAIVYISHKLEEVFQVADTITVLRDGQRVTTAPAASLDRARLIPLMVGRELEIRARQATTAKGEIALEVRELSRPGKFQDIRFTLRKGEILGFAGLMGAGRTELMNAIYGIAPAEGGQIRVHGRNVRIIQPRDALKHGIAYVSEDRKGTGLVLPMSVQHNLTLSNLQAYCRGWFIRQSAEAELADSRIQALGIKTPHRNQSVKYLSGGNQQKVAIARALLTEPDILILDEPTRGIDIGAKAEIYALINQLAAQGKAILLVSSELPELLALSDRILVMRAGTITAALEAANATQEQILRLAMPQ